MKIIQFSYFSKDDYSDTIRQARSRCYEYPFVLKTIKELGISNPIIHNTGCGGGQIHIQFSDELENYGTVINSDTDGIWSGKRNNEFMIYDIMKGGDIQADITLCVSTLEHLSNQVLALQNLIEATKEGGYIIVTLDSPPVNIEAIENFLDCKCEGVETKLNQWNSKIKNPAFTDEINVVRLVIQK